MGLNTRALTSDAAETYVKPAATGMSTEETIRVNALDFLNEMARPVRRPQESSLRFQPVPLEPSMRDRLQWQAIQPWHIVVMPTERPYDFMALELLGDVVMGSNDVTQAGIDVNLASIGGYDRGVSRRHVMLRPTREKLYVIDLHSTNGTCVNGMPSPVGEAHPLRDGDLLSVGHLHLQIKIARRPEASR
jgi:hypothetical protein